MYLIFFNTSTFENKFFNNLDLNFFYVCNVGILLICLMLYEKMSLYILYCWENI